MYLETWNANSPIRTSGIVLTHSPRAEAERLRLKVTETYHWETYYPPILSGPLLFPTTSHIQVMGWVPRRSHLWSFSQPRHLQGSQACGVKEAGPSGKTLAGDGHTHECDPQWLQINGSVFRKVLEAIPPLA